MVYLMQSCPVIIRTAVLNPLAFPPTRITLLSHPTTTMYFIPNQVYAVFSFTGFIMCAIPFYWHFEAWNAGTCLYMAWTGLGCLIHCINSIVWNKNTIDRAPFYCDIIIHLQNGLNVALPACGLCVNRRLYKITTARAVIITKAEKRRAIMVDLLIGIGIPVLQMITVHVVLENRYQIFEDFGPYPSIAITPPSFFLFFAWPLAIGCVDYVYCSMTIYTFYKHNRQIRLISPAINRGRYFRLMAFTFIEIIAGIPLQTYVIVFNAMKGVTPWKSWADMHKHYSLIPRWPAAIWKDKPTILHALEFSRWVFVGVAFFFFAIFGFADEARQHYRLVYKWLVSRIRRLASLATRTPRGTLDVTPTLPQMKSERGIAGPQGVVTTPAHERAETGSSTDLPSISSLFPASDPNFTIEASSSSGLEQGLADQPLAPQPEVVTPAVDSSPGTVSPDLQDTSESKIRGYRGDAADTV